MSRQPRKVSRRLITTYVKKSDGRYGVRIIDARTSLESRCTKNEVEDAVRCARVKVRANK